MNIGTIITWFLMLLYGLPTTALLIVDASQGFVRIKAQPIASLILIGIGYFVVSFGLYVLRSDKKERLKRQELRQKLGGKITTLTFNFEDGSRAKWYIPVNKVFLVYDAIKSLKLDDHIE